MKSIFSLLCLFSMFFSFSFKAPVFSDVEELRNLGEVYFNKGEFERALPRISRRPLLKMIQKPSFSWAKSILMAMMQ